MASVTVDLPDGIHLRLAEKAAQNGQPLEAYIRGVLETEVGLTNGAPAGARPALSPNQAVEEFDRWLAELKRLPPIPFPPRRLSDEEFERWRAELKDRKLPPLPPLPDDFSREDIYSDHD
jgi:plasmid stability protein